MAIFKELYPELVEKNQIKYPIDDKLVKKMPDLHGAHMIREPPNFKKVIICIQEFEDLLYIWEFFNNFSDFLEIPMFNLEELQASLSFVSQTDRVRDSFIKDIGSQEEITDDPLQGFNWNQQSTIQEIQENGFNLLNQMHLALVKAIFNNIDQIYSNQTSSSVQQDTNENSMLIQLIMSINKEDCNQEKVWTEMIRLLVMHADEKLDIDQEGLDPYIQDLLKQVGKLTP